MGQSFADLQNPYYASLRDQLVKDFGAAGVTFQETDSHQDAATQLADVENMVEKGLS